MILTAQQPGYLPWLGLFDKIAQADTFVSFDAVQYMPKEWQNRNLIKTPTGPVWLTVPVLRKGYRDKPLYEIRVNNQEPWQRRHWRTIEHNYCKAPYFGAYSAKLHSFYQVKWETLVALNETMLRWLLAELGIEITFLCASDHNFEGTKSALVLDMCRKLGATTYIFGALGRDYADTAAFADAGIEVQFHRYEHPTYPQQHGGFVPHLSVLDLLLNSGPDSLEILRNR
jgi:WbqC-like protein family